MPVTVLQALAVGALSTLSMDVLTGLALRLGMVAPLTPELVGRWFVSVARVRPIHVDIARSPAVHHEFAIALPIHYAIGLFLTSFYLWTTYQLHVSPRNVALALTFGLLTNALPWMVMFPAMGYGFFGLHGPAGTRLFASSLLSHAFFGLGIWIGVRATGLS
jgi:hypothetical protein